jgi:hypothetical protein
VLFCAGLLFVLFAGNDLLLDMMPALPAAELRPVSPYLSHRARSAAARDVLRLMRRRREQLYRVQREMEELEEDRERFLSGMEQRSEVFARQRSLFGLDEDRKELRSIAGLVGMSVEFRGELARRKRLYLDLYESRRRELEQAAESCREELDRLARLSGAIASREQEPPGLPSGFLLDRAYRGHLDGLVRALRGGDLDSAVREARALQRLAPGAEEEELAGLVGGLADVVRRYAEQLEALRTGSPLHTLAMHYLAEEYERAERERAAAAESSDLLRPLLAGLEGKLFAARQEAERVAGVVEQNRALRKNVQRARRLEEEGELEEAMAAYQELLLEPLQPHDREQLARTLRSLWVPAEMMRIKREQNTRAIKYLESARLLENEGRELEALEFYAMLVVECPSSDYMEESMRRILNAARFGR